MKINAKTIAAQVAVALVASLLAAWVQAEVKKRMEAAQ